MNLFSNFIALVSILVVFTISISLKIVPQGEKWTVEKLGRFTKMLEPGLHFLKPFLERIGKKIDIRESVLDVPPQDVITQDNAMVRVDGVIFYKVFDCARASYQVRNLDYAMSNLCLTNIRTVMGAMTLDALLSNREKINATLLSVVDEATDPWGVKITRIEIKDITPPKDLVQSMARQMKAEREKRASILESSAVRESAILEAQGKKEAKVLEAKGAKEATFFEAEGRERLAEAEAKAMRLMLEELTTKKGGDNTQAINYMVAKEYIKSLERIGSSSSGKTIFLPTESSNILGALGGVGALAKDLLSPESKATKKK